MRRLVVLLATCAAGAALASIPAGCGDDAASGAGDAALDTPNANGEAGDAATGDAGGFDATVVPKGARVLGLSVVIGDVDFLRNVQTARDAGARTTDVTFAWDEIERPYDAGAPDGSGGGDGGGGDGGGDGGPARSPTQVFHPLLHVANLVLSDQRVAAAVTIDALDVGGSRAPAELATLALDDPELLTRYDRVLDYALDQLPDLELSALFLASSVDVPLGDDAAKHAAFATFLTNAAAHVHAARPSVKVGFVVTSDGAVARKDRLAAAWAASDVIGVTYLPIDAAARVRSATEVAGAVGSDVDALLAALPAGKPVVVREAGYPTAAANGGGEDGQAAFVAAVFGAWDRHAARIPVLTFRELFDADATTSAALAARYGHSDPAFLAFLRSLGLQTADRAKPGFDALIKGSRARGF